MKNKIILSICIPTYNRKDSIYECVTKILNNYVYDNIEVIVSDNCSDDGTQDKLIQIEDARFKYYRNNENIKWMNLLKVMSYSNGQYSLLISDEDDVKIENLEGLLQYLDGRKDISLLRGDVFNAIRHTTMGFTSNNMKEDNYYNKIIAILKWAYMSGIVYNNNLILPILRKLDYTHYYKSIKKIGDYPHMWLALLICHKGPVIFFNKVLVIHARECPRDYINKQFIWEASRRLEQSMSVCKSFKYLKVSTLSGKEKISLYCERINWVINAIGLGYCQILYDKDFENDFKKYYSKDVQMLYDLREKSYNVNQMFFTSYKKVNNILKNYLWKTKLDFIKDFIKNGLLIGKLYCNILKQYYGTKKYLHKTK